LVRYGFTDDDWKMVRSEIRSILVDVAASEGTITYSDLVSGVTSAKLEANQYALFEMLGEISWEESKAGRGMLTAVVISKDSNLPGPGFFGVAEELGYTITDRDLFWVEELRKVHSSWVKDKRR